MKIKKINVVIFLVVSFIIFCANPIMAVNINNLEIEEVEYTEEYKNWLELSDEEKSNYLQPNKYKIENKESSNDFQQSNNPIQLFRILKNSANSSYSLKDIIYDNVKIKNQMQTNACWAFTSIGAVETNLAIQDHLNSSTKKVYDFSERHMVYSSVREGFLNQKVNDKGFNVNVSTGGNCYMAQAYLTNGLGAINEFEMPFENSEANIDISNIQGKTPVTTLYDTVGFNTITSNKDELMQRMKAHLSTYGGIFSAIYGDGIVTSEFYNNETGALFVSDKSKNINHAVLIIGWDDNYSKENFVETNRPQNDGAWIIRNSWGEKDQITLDEFKKSNYESYKEYYNSNGIYNYKDLPDKNCIEILLENGYTPNSDNTVFSYKIGDNGYMYVSYEDVKIYSQLWGVKKATNDKDYDKIYQNDIQGYSKLIQYKNVQDKIYIANAFNRKTSESEKIDKISVFTLQNWKNCKVYINPSNTDKSTDKLQEIKLKYPDSNSNEIDLEPGYHMIEFAEPVEVDGESFVVVVKFETNDLPAIPLESQDEGYYKYVECNENESFIAVSDDFENNEWLDTVTFPQEELRGNVLIKAFTQKKANNNNNNSNIKLSNIVVTKQPKKTNYKEGENFDPQGMEVTATFSDGSKKIVDNYKVEDGNSLTLGKEFVLISYTENGITVKATLPIVVTSNGETNNNNKVPKSSDFSNANATYTRMEISSENKICQISVKITNIKIGDKDDKYQYSYCLLPTALTTDAKDEYWINIDSNKVYKENDGTYSIDIDIDWNKLKNANELVNVSEIYIHVKEIAEINNQSIESINPVKLTINVEFANTINEDSSNPTIDDTVAPSILPKAGKECIIIIAIIILSVGCFAYYKYKNIDR